MVSARLTAQQKALLLCQLVCPLFGGVGFLDSRAT